MSYITLPSSGGSDTIKTDLITIRGDGSSLDPVALLQVQTDGATITGDGTVANPLVATGGGGKPQTMAYMWVNKTTQIAPPAAVPFTQFPLFDSGEWTEEVTSGDWDTVSGSLRCFKDGVYKITGQFTYELTELVPSNTEFILRGGLVQAVDPSLPMYCQGYLHANIESNTAWTGTVHFQWMGFVSKNQEFFPFVDVQGDPCDLIGALNFSTNVVIEEVSQ